MSPAVEKKIKTAVLVFIWATKGLYFEIGGPTMIDFMLRLNTNHEHVARAISAIGIGAFPGAVIAGVFTDWLGNWKDLIMAICQTVAATAVISMPFVHSVDMLWALFFVVGVCTSIVNVVGQKFIFELWEEKAPSPMHACHAGFGIGALLAPLIANQFLAVTSVMPPPENVTSSGLTSPSPAAYHVIKESRVQYAFIIISIITLIGGFPFLFYQAKKCIKKGIGEYETLDAPKQQARKSFKEIINPATYARGSLGFGICIFVILFIYYVNLVGGEQLFGNFIRTYSVDELQFSRDHASYLDVVFWLCFTIGRFSGFILARWIPIRILYLAEIILYLITTTAVDIFAARSQLTLWIFTAVQGLIVAPLYPTGVSYGNTQIEISGFILMIVEIATGTGAAFYVWMTGHMYDTYGPRSVLVGMQVSGIAVFVISAIFLTVGYFRGNRFDKMRQELSQTIDVNVNLEPLPRDDRSFTDTRDVQSGT